LSETCVKNKRTSFKSNDIECAILKNNKGAFKRPPHVIIIKIHTLKS